MKNKFIIESLASDLKRVAMGKHRGSERMAERFFDEALKRKTEIENSELPHYIQKLLDKIDSEANIDADDALMYSTLFQNYAQKL